MNIGEIKNQIKNYLGTEMYHSALFLCEKIILLEGSEYWRLKHADILRMCGFFSKSEKMFNSIKVQNIPVEYQYYYHLYFGHLLKDINKIQDAKAQFNECLAFEACDTVPYIYLSSLLTAERDNEEGIAYLTEALKKAGDIDEVYYNLANRLLIKGDVDSALSAINNCLEIDPNFPNAKNLRNDLVEYQSLQTNTSSI